MSIVIDTRRPIRSSSSATRPLMACDQTWLIAITRSGAPGDAVPLRVAQELSADPPATAAAATAASLPKERRLTGWLLVDILVLDSLDVLFLVPRMWSNW